MGPHWASTVLPAESPFTLLQLSLLLQAPAKCPSWTAHADWQCRSSQSADLGWIHGLCAASLRLAQPWQLQGPAGGAPCSIQSQCTVPAAGEEHLRLRCPCCTCRRAFHAASLLLHLSVAEEPQLHLAAAVVRLEPGEARALSTARQQVQLPQAVTDSGTKSKPRPH